MLIWTLVTYVKHIFQKPIPSHVPSTPTQPSQHSYHQPPRPTQEPPAQTAHQNGSQSNQQQQPGQQPVEFNHAINYVNKIKVGNPAPIFLSPASPTHSGTASPDSPPEWFAVQPPATGCRVQQNNGGHPVFVHANRILWHFLTCCLLVVYIMHFERRNA